MINRSISKINVQANNPTTRTTTTTTRVHSSSLVAVVVTTTAATSLLAVVVTTTPTTCLAAVVQWTTATSRVQSALTLAKIQPTYTNSNLEKCIKVRRTFPLFFVGTRLVKTQNRELSFRCFAYNIHTCYGSASKRVISQQ